VADGVVLVEPRASGSILHETRTCSVSYVLVLLVMVRASVMARVFLMVRASVMVELCVMVLACSNAMCAGKRAEIILVPGMPG